MQPTLPLAAILTVLAGPALAEVPRVVATIKPIHSLVAAVMGDLGTPDLIVEGAASAHTYSLKPSDAAELQSADLVFWSGRGFELFLEDSLATLAPNATALALSEAPGLTLLPVREGGAFEVHEHEGEEHEHEHEHENEDNPPAPDMHFWLDPANAIFMVNAIADALSANDPEHAEIYQDNATRETEALLALREELDAKLGPVADRRFIVFHDAYQYFENSFGLTTAGSVTVTPDVSPGARRVAALRERILESGAVCIFAEPQFEPAIVAAIAEGTTARTGTLDPEGATLEPGPELYPTLLRKLADDVVACLAPTP